MQIDIPMESHEGALQIVSSAICVWMVQGFKGIKGTDWFNKNAKPLSVGLAMLTSVGFTFSIDGTLFDGGHLQIGFPGMMTLITHSTSGSVAQHYMYLFTKMIQQNKEIIEKLASSSKVTVDDI